MSERKLTELQQRVLTGLRRLQDGNPARYAFSGNEIGIEIDAKTVTGSGRGGGRGSGFRVFGAAQQIIPVLNSLERRDLIRSAPRDDLKSGSAYRLTANGEIVAREIA